MRPRLNAFFLKSSKMRAAKWVLVFLGIVQLVFSLWHFIVAFSIKDTTASVSTIATLSAILLVSCLLLNAYYLLKKIKVLMECKMFPVVCSVFLALGLIGNALVISAPEVYKKLESKVSLLISAYLNLFVFVITTIYAHSMVYYTKYKPNYSCYYP